ncbi:enoyl-CoA hydratase/isomerase family protein [Hymenobacter sp. 15J16-1T3B]|uniref:enoyl-CoA hydratase/isomerase family protein n=1 Tax=Hymenobacter sp. 15J16-1T3B TaxID=2886941 RepID=UPI001D12BF47|nr:enoyl-CoA hydratase-related protein [Hymenobacter sp. 15J16-1T3B]MCC3159960.1 enoyl-CoA hydratase/isomerase family protein [Hymenobacter sp. 15J16-1T3B]
MLPVLENLALDLTDNGILVITLNRPSKLNALNAATIEDIGRAMQSALDNPQVRGVILTGAGDKAFVAGADIAELAALDELQARRAAERGQEVFCTIEESTKPVIAAVNGFALGGGCELAMACHFRVASDNARFGQPEVNLGLIPGYGGTQRLTQLVGKGKALELMMTADMIKADEALRLGLVNHVVPQAELLGFCQQLLGRILTKAPLAVGLVIDSVNAYFDKERHGYQTEANAFARCFASDDFREGTQAFLEKRPAAFTGK